MKYLVIGLGNIENKYTYTRHNTGFLFLDYLADHIKDNFIYNKKFNGDILIFKNIVFFKPHSFMNNSGDNIPKILNFYDIEEENLIITYDDLDIKFKEFKIGKKFSHTHNGILSVISNIKNPNFINIRIGINNRDIPIPGVQYVLSEFSKDEIKTLNNDVFPNIKNIIMQYLDEE